MPLYGHLLNRMPLADPSRIAMKFAVNEERSSQILRDHSVLAIRKYFVIINQ